MADEYKRDCNGEMDQFHPHLPGQAMVTASYNAASGSHHTSAFEADYDLCSADAFGPLGTFHGSTLFPMDQMSPFDVSSNDVTLPVYGSACDDLGVQGLDGRDHHGSSLADLAPCDAMYDHESAGSLRSHSQSIRSGGSNDAFAANALCGPSDWTPVSEEFAGHPMSASSSGYGYSQAQQHSPFLPDQCVIEEDPTWHAGSTQLHADLPYRGLALEPRGSSLTYGATERFELRNFSVKVILTDFLQHGPVRCRAGGNWLGISAFP